MQKIRTFLWKSPDYDKPVEKMAYINIFPWKMHERYYLYGGNN